MYSYWMNPKLHLHITTFTHSYLEEKSVKVWLIPYYLQKI